MRITEITMLPVWVGLRNQLIVKVDTDEGIRTDRKFKQPNTST